MKTKAKQRFTTIILIIVLAALASITIGLGTLMTAKAAIYTGAPQITVLTHGLGGRAKHWSSADGLGVTFAEDSDSLLYKLSEKAGGAKIYRAETRGGNYSDPKYTLYENYGETVADINSVSKHIIIVFDSSNSTKSNDTVYVEFKYMLNDIIARVKELNPGKQSPKVNLIGHSRGGITNLQYALDYPQNVDSLISIGTPYFGSSAAESFGNILFGSSLGLDDICNESIYDGYYQRWTTGYESKYKDINSIAIGGVTNVDYQCDVLNANGGLYADALSSLLSCYSDAVSQRLSMIYLKSNYSTLVEKYPSLKIFSKEKFSELITLLDSEIHFGTWYSDVFVPVDSQQGFSGEKNYYFTKYVKEFNKNNTSLYPKRADENIQIIHNIETYDSDIHNYILKNIIMKAGDTIDNEISNVGKVNFVDIFGQDQHKWQIKIRNTHDETRTYAYNTKMCFNEDAKNWTSLTDVKFVRLKSGETKIVEIESNYAATSIAISSVKGSTRYICYADNLWFNSNVLYNDNVFQMTCYNSTKPYYSYEQNGIKVSIADKKGTTWLIELTNNTGTARSFDYNYMMCLENDAKNWSGIIHIENTGILSNGDTTLIKINEYLAATSIVISYKVGSIERYIFYANNLDVSGTMTSYASRKPTYYTQNGIQVGIIDKDNGVWSLHLINRTGKSQRFEYNTKMCFEGDAKNWKGLSDTTNTDIIPNGQDARINIQENGTATSIAISYMDGNYRKIFYANKLSTMGVMTAYGNTIDTTQASDECVAEGTLITLADGNKKAVEDLTGDEQLLVWNMKTGSLDSAPILFVDSEPIGHYEVINLTFSDGTTVKVISEHGFWDVDLNKYVYLDKNAEQYLGHSFNKQTENADGTYGWTEVQLIGVDISEEVTTVYSPVTYGHLCYYVNGMLSMPGGIAGLFNIFEVDDETMKIDEEAFAEDIAAYGTFTYEEFYELYPISEEVFEAYNGRYLKVAIGKGLITYERIGELIERYSKFF